MVLSRSFDAWSKFAHHWTSPYSSEVQLSTPTTKGKEWGGVGKVTPNGWAHLYLSADFHYLFLLSIGKGRVRRTTRGVGRDAGADCMS
jgi:hypothetical protein